jgi:hypothetical protein
MSIGGNPRVAHAWRCGQQGIVAEVGCGPKTHPMARLLDCPKDHKLGGGVRAKSFRQ